VIQNVSLHLRALLNPKRSGSGEMACNEIILFGRHEERKGIVPFCDALDLIGDRLAARNVTVTFLGGFGVVNGEVSPLYLVNRSRKWHFPMRFLPDFDRLTACRYIAESKRSVVVVPSVAENSPCTVLEAAIFGRPLITSAEGGACELLDPAIASALICKIDRKSLAARLMSAVDHGLPPARPAVPPEKTARLWIDLHRRPTSAVRPAQPTAGVASAATPKVVAAITHYERPAKLYDALMSLVTQTYPNLEIVVVDDGSESDETQDLLRRLEPLMTKLGVRLLYQDNRYLGAARNHAIVNSKSEYVLFLDDDDIAFPNLVQTLVTAAEATRADVMNCLNLYMPESRRTEAHPFPDQFSQKVSYVPIGGPVSMAPLENCFGAATALLRRSALGTVSGYTEQRGIGHEDFELYTRILQSGLSIEVCPLPLYLYEVDHSGMVACTSPLRNWNRIALAIDVTAKPEAWSDLVSMVAGRRAREHAQNFAEYKVATSLHKDVLRQLGDEPRQSVRYAELLSEYAASTGATAAMQAAHALAATRSKRPDDDSTAMMPLPVAMTTVSRESEIAIEGLALGILIDLSFGRVAEAVSAFALLWERQGCLGSPALRRILLALANRRDLTSEQAGRVLILLKQRLFSQSELQPLVAVMFRFALRCQDMQAASALADRAIRADEEAYLRANQDVALAVSGGKFPAALDHFAYAGQKEGRPGFETVREIQQALQAHLGVDVPVTSLRQSIPSGQKVQRVPAVSPNSGRKSAPRWGTEKSGTLHALGEAAASRRTRVIGS
jgi:GT2 family glycosyltransferase